MERRPTYRLRTPPYVNEIATVNDACSFFSWHSIMEARTRSWTPGVTKYVIATERWKRVRPWRLRALCEGHYLRARSPSASFLHAHPDDRDGATGARARGARRTPGRRHPRPVGARRARAPPRPGGRPAAPPRPRLSRQPRLLGRRRGAPRRAFPRDRPGSARVRPERAAPRGALRLR